VDEGQTKREDDLDGLGVVLLADVSYAEGRREAFDAYIRSEIEEATSPINIAQLGSDLMPEFGQLIAATNYLGCHSLGAYLRSLGIPGWSVQTHHFVREGMLVKTPAVLSDDELPAELLRQLRNLNVPLLDSTVWRALFEAIREYADTQDFHYNSCAKWIRDEANALEERSIQELQTPSRAQINYVVRGCAFGGLPMQSAKGRSSKEFTDAFIRSLMRNIEFSPNLETELVRVALNHWMS
jgi:hypothetical protein